MSCDVTERYTPRTLSQYYFVRLLQLQPKVAENPSFEQEEFLRVCHSEKQSFGFLKKDPRNQVLFNLSGLSRAATGTRRLMNFFLEFMPMNLCTMEELRLRTVVERGNKANVYIVSIMLHYGISRHFQALANVLKRSVKSVSPGKKINK